MYDTPGRDSQKSCDMYPPPQMTCILLLMTCVTPQAEILKSHVTCILLIETYERERERETEWDTYTYRRI
jgi:hypothetical protein